MLSRILTIFSISLIATKTTDGAPAVATARQFLPEVPGYVPVYIRNGDTPLEEINPDLAEAFNSYSQKHARHAFSRSSNTIADKTDTEVKNDSPDNAKEDIKDVSLEEDPSLDNEEESGASQKIQTGESYTHIQKIPRP